MKKTITISKNAITTFVDTSNKGEKPKWLPLRTTTFNNFDGTFTTTGYYKAYDYDAFFSTIHYDKLPKEFWINEEKKTVVLKWNDDTITKVKTTKGDKFDARVGFLIAYFQKHCGMSKNKANQFLDKLVANKDKV